MSEGLGRLGPDESGSEDHRVPHPAQSSPNVQALFEGDHGRYAVQVEAIIEPAIDELLPDANWRRSEWSEGRTMWFFEFPEGILWGATAYMVRELLELFRR